MSDTQQNHALDRIEDAIKLLIGRIENHGKHIAGHETRTRVILIDPLLRALGWDPEDPDLVVHEYAVDNRKPDYALMLNGHPVIVIEAKKLGVKLDKLEPGKLAGFLLAPVFANLQAVVSTNGDDWLVYRKTTGFNEEKLSVSSGATFKTAFDFHQTLGFDPVQPRKWHPLSRALPSSRKPSMVRVKGEESEVSSWIGMYVEIGKLLAKCGLLSLNRVSSGLVSKDGAQFRTKRQIAPGMYVEGHGSARDLIKRSVELCKDLKISLPTVEVSFD